MSSGQEIPADATAPVMADALRHARSRTRPAAAITVYAIVHVGTNTSRLSATTEMQIGLTSGIINIDIYNQY